MDNRLFYTSASSSSQGNFSITPFNLHFQHMLYSPSYHHYTQFSNLKSQVNLQKELIRPFQKCPFYWGTPMTFHFERLPCFSTTDQTLFMEPINPRESQHLEKPSENLTDLTSPVTGLRIISNNQTRLSPTSSSSSEDSRKLEKTDTLNGRIVRGDIDSHFNQVEVTQEARERLAKIPNHIGEFKCKLCCVLYSDAFELAKHRCPRIVHVEYKCLECHKVFNCPANLASHKRWHRPSKKGIGSFSIEAILGNKGKRSKKM